MLANLMSEPSRFMDWNRIRVENRLCSNKNHFRFIIVKLQLFVTKNDDGRPNPGTKDLVQSEVILTGVRETRSKRPPEEWREVPKQRSAFLSFFLKQGDLNT